MPAPAPFHDHACHAMPAPAPAHDHAKHEPDIDGDEFVRDVRSVQHKTKCSTKTCMEFIQLFERYMKGTLPAKFDKCDKGLKEAAGIDVIELNGCHKCHGHVYGPGDERTECPCCGTARFDENGKAHERVFYFPLAPRFRKLFKIDSFRESLRHEYERPRNEAFMSDVYDSPAWKQFMGAATSPLQRIGLLFCVDAIPAFAAGTLSLKPMEFINLNLPPGVRTKAENIMILMLLSSSIKGVGQKKYYDFAAEFELNDLATTGQCIV